MVVVNYKPSLALEFVYMYIKIPVQFYYSKIYTLRMCCSLKQDKTRAESDSRTCRDSVLTDSRTDPETTGSAKGATGVQRDESGPRSSQEAKSRRQGQLSPGLGAG